MKLLIVVNTKELMEKYYVLDVKTIYILAMITNIV